MNRVKQFLESKTEFLLSLLFFVGFAGQSLRYALGWVGFGAIDGLLIVVACIAYSHNRKKIKVPKALLGFVVLCLLSTAWSQYKLETLLGSAIQLATFIVAVLIASSHTWPQILRNLSRALKWIIVSSYILELYAAIILKAPIMPFVGAVPGYAWVDGSLLRGGPIQGIPGNRNLLAFIALLALIVFTVQFFDKSMSLKKYVPWAAITVVAVVLTDSATIVLSIFALAVLSVLILLMRKVRPALQRFAYYGLGSVLLLSLVTLVAFSATIFGFLGRSDDLSGRTTIWRSVYHLIKQHAFAGWGWIGYWAPWVEPFKNLAVLNGTTYLQAHNALLDIVFQTGLLGGLVALVVALRGSVRAWRFAVTPVNRNGKAKAYKPITALPVLLLAALLIQSLTESRLLLEGNWLLFVIVCCKVYASDPPRLITLRK